MATKINISFIKSNPGLSLNQERDLGNIIKKHSRSASRILGIPRISITVYAKSAWTIPETGEGGYTPSEDWIQIYIDPKHKNNNFKLIANKLIPGTLYHEMNHIARWRNVGYGKSLLEVIISEGLASAFEKEYWKLFIPPWTQSDDAEISNLLSVIKSRNKNDDFIYNHGVWFYGEGKLPKWAGYKIGTYIVESFRKKFPEISWENLAKIKANEIIKKSGIKI